VPDNLLLFFHHVPYSYRLRSGKTVIQHIYDAHYDGAEKAESYVLEWESLRGRIGERPYAEILAKLEFQAGHARVWRDAVCRWFHKISGIPDEKNRVGRYPERVEAESMRLRGYAPMDIVPWENSSGGRGVECGTPEGCEASFRFDRSAGWYDLDVEYFDQNNGESRYRLFLNGQLVDKWTADNRLPGGKPGGDTSSRRRIKGLALRPGDEIRIEGVPDRGERAALDFVALRN
jgi:alpha-glucuronidase